MQTNRSRQRGFTLVEMLVVLAIIAVLVGLLLPAVMAAVNAARRGQMAMEISQLAQAVEAYKNEFGDYPPSLDTSLNWSDATVRANSAVERHIRKCFPKITAQEKDDFYTKIAPKLDQGEALVFWLSGIKKNPRQPFFGTGETYKFYDFDTRRLIDTDDDDILGLTGDDSDDLAVFRPSHAKDTCYIYMDAKHYGNYTAANPAKGESLDTSVELQVRPYTQPGGTKGVNNTTFQIICAGQDGIFSDSVASYKQFPNGANYGEADMDNITNFSDGRRLEDNLP